MTTRVADDKEKPHKMHTKHPTKLKQNKMCTILTRGPPELVRAPQRAQSSKNGSKVGSWRISPP
eukprot:2786252-Amphidinium_carterae.1